MQYAKKISNKLDSMSLSMYGVRKNPKPTEYMTKDEMIALSPLGSTQNTRVSNRYAKQRESLPPAIKKSLGYLFPPRNTGESLQFLRTI